MVGHHEAGDHRLAQAPAGLDQPLVGAGDRMLGEHHAGHHRVEQRLHHHADARPREQAHLLAVGDGRIGVGRPPDLAHRVRARRPPSARSARSGAGRRSWPLRRPRRRPRSAPQRAAAARRWRRPACRWPCRRSARPPRPGRPTAPRPAAPPGRGARPRPSRRPWSRRARSRAPCANGTTCFTQHRHLAGIAIDAHAHAVADALGGRRACRPRRGCRTRAPRSPHATAARRCR